MEECIKEKRCIVTAVNEKYIPYLSVMIISLLKNIDQYYMYEIVIMYENLSDEAQKKIREIRVQDNVDIQFINVSSFIQGYDFFTGGRNNNLYLSKETYFRLLAPELLQEYKYLLYLDCDIIVKKGWTDIFDKDIRDYFLAAVTDIWGNWKCYNKCSELYQYRKVELGLEDPLAYFNAGVLMINVEKIRLNFSTKELIDLAVSKKWKKHDQDLLNCLCKGKILFLDYSWNLIECPSRKARETVPKYEIEKYNKCMKEPRIIHYASRKPWIANDCFFEHEFWRTAILSPFFDELFQKYIKEHLSQGKYFEENVYSSIKQRKLGIRFILRCITHYLKRVMHIY